MTRKTITDVNRRTGKAAWLIIDAAASYERMKRSRLPGGCINDAGRTNAEQWKLYKAWLATGKTNPPSVAYPGTSLHEKGNAIDVREPARAWMHRYGKYYGWVNPAWAKRASTYEPWHFEYGSKPDRSKPTKLKITKTLNKATKFAICRATKRPAITSAPTAAGQKSFWKHIQRHVNRIMKGTKGWTRLKVDGYPGPLTIRGLQTSLRKTNKVHRPKVDGKLGPHTIECWQRALNAGARNAWSQRA